MGNYGKKVYKFKQSKRKISMIKLDNMCCF